MKKLTLAYLGSGPISHYHVPAIRNAGFDITANFTRAGSDNLSKFGELYGLRVSETYEEFFESASSADATMVSVKTEAAPELVRDLSRIGKPMLVEKPGALDAEVLDELAKSTKYPELIRFAYNRRLYRTVEFVKKFVPEIQAVSVCWPETKTSDHQFVINGCHLVDLIRYVMGDVEIVSLQSLGTDQGFIGQLSSQTGVPISFVAPFGKAKRAEIVFYLEGARQITVSPLESARLFGSMEVIEPSAESPIRVYEPVVEEAIFETASEFKPGFEEQAKEFHRFCQNPDSGSLLPDLAEAMKSLKLTNRLLGG